MKLNEFVRQITNLRQLLEAAGRTDVDVLADDHTPIISILLESDEGDRDNLNVVLLRSSEVKSSCP